MMFSLTFLKSKFFLCVVLFLIFIGYTYKVHSIGYNNALQEASSKAINAKDKHDEEIRKLEAEFSGLEEQYLKEEAKATKEFERKYETAMEQIRDYVKNNDYSDCSIGTNGVQRVNDLLKRSTTNDK